MGRYTLSGFTNTFYVLVGLFPRFQLPADCVMIRIVVQQVDLENTGTSPLEISEENYIKKQYILCLAVPYFDSPTRESCASF